MFMKNIIACLLGLLATTVIYPSAEQKEKMAKFNTVSLDSFFAYEKERLQTTALYFDWSKASLTISGSTLLKDGLSCGDLRLKDFIQIPSKAARLEEDFKGDFTRINWKGISFIPFAFGREGSLVLINQKPTDEKNPQIDSNNLIMGIIVSIYRDKSREVKTAVQTGTNSVILDIPYKYLYQSVPLLQVLEENRKVKILKSEAGAPGGA